MGTHVLVYGAGGQAGREFLALARLHELTVTGLTHIQCDIADEHSVQRSLDETAPSIVINAAAYTAVDRAESEEAAAFRANALGPQVLAQATARRAIPLVHLSTDYVFDGTKSGAYVETDTVNPLSVYGRSKLAGEEAVRTHNVRHVIMRTAWVYSVHGSNFLKTILRLSAERDQLAIVGDQFGRPTAAADIAEAILAVTGRALLDECPWGTYHFCGTGVTSWQAFAQRIVAAQTPFTHRAPVVRKIATHEYPVAAQRPQNSVLSCEKFERTFLYQAKHWHDRTEETVRALLAPAAVER